MLPIQKLSPSLVLDALITCTDISAVLDVRSWRRRVIRHRNQRDRHRSARLRCAAEPRHSSARPLCAKQHIARAARERIIGGTSRPLGRHRHFFEGVRIPSMQTPTGRFTRALGDRAPVRAEIASAVPKSRHRRIRVLMTRSYWKQGPTIAWLLGAATATSVCPQCALVPAAVVCAAALVRW